MIQNTRLEVDSTVKPGHSLRTRLSTVELVMYHWIEFSHRRPLTPGLTKTTKKNRAPQVHEYDGRELDVLNVAQVPLSFTQHGWQLLLAKLPYFCGYNELDIILYWRYVYVLMWSSPILTTCVIGYTTWQTQGSTSAVLIFFTACLISFTACLHDFASFLLQSILDLYSQHNRCTSWPIREEVLQNAISIHFKHYSWSATLSLE
jgi:hypothetical protein